MDMRPQRQIKSMLATGSRGLDVRSSAKKPPRCRFRSSVVSRARAPERGAAEEDRTTAPRNRRKIFPPSSSSVAKAAYRNASNYLSSMSAWGAHTLSFLSSVLHITPRTDEDDARVPPVIPATAVSPEAYWVIRERGHRTSRPTYGTMFLPDPETGVYERFVMAFLRKEDAEATLAPLCVSSVPDAEVEYLSWRDLSVAISNSLGVAVFETDAIQSCGPTDDCEHPCRIIRRTTTEDVSGDRDVANEITAALNRCLSE